MAKVLGIGNALVDILTFVEDESILEALKLPKGSMQLVDGTTADYISSTTQHLNKSKASGGSAANTIHGLARLGVETAFIGHVGMDETGDFFRLDMEQAFIKPILFASKTPTGIASGMITKDGERTFATYLGAAIELSDEHLDDSHFHGYDYFYIEGYLVQNEKLLIKSLELAKKSKAKIVLDLASYNIVEANRELLDRILTNYVDIVFANEEEAKAFTRSEPEEAVKILAEKCELAIVKIGAKGSLIRKGNYEVKVDAISATVFDTTGAGDLFAAGFLYGILKGFDLRKAGMIGSVLAGNVIEVAGPKMDADRWNSFHQKIAAL